MKGLITQAGLGFVFALALWSVNALPSAWPDRALDPLAERHVHEAAARETQEGSASRHAWRDRAGRNRTQAPAE